MPVETAMSQQVRYVRPNGGGRAGRRTPPGRQEEPLSCARTQSRETQAIMQRQAIHSDFPQRNLQRL